MKIILRICLALLKLHLFVYASANMSTKMSSCDSTQCGQEMDNIPTTAPKNKYILGNNFSSEEIAPVGDDSLRMKVKENINIHDEQHFSDLKNAEDKLLGMTQENRSVYKKNDLYADNFGLLEKFDIGSGIKVENDFTEKRGDKLQESMNVTEENVFNITDNILENTTKMNGIDNKDQTLAELNETINFFPIQNGNDLFIPKNYKKSDYEYCICDKKINECDINCCCDRDCSENMIQIFTKCEDAVHSDNYNLFCNSLSLFRNNAVGNGNSLLCVVKNNLLPKSVYREDQIIHHMTSFQKIISQTNIFSFSPSIIHDLQMKNSSYHMGDLLWSVEGDKLIPFGIPHHTADFQCNSEKKILYLSEFSTKCLQLIPKSKRECEGSLFLGMKHFLRDIKLIKSPDAVKQSNSTNSDKICNSKTCTDISSYICPEILNKTSCYNASSKSKFASWSDGVCANMVSAVEYHIYHNGTKGIIGARAYFELIDYKSDKYSFTEFVQHINVKFLWSEKRQTFYRSGNPGYLIGKPILAGKKIYLSNDTQLMRKEAIELSVNPTNWLSVFKSKDAMCIPEFREVIRFGENLHRSCFVEIKKRELSKEGCNRLQERVFSLLLGNDFNDIRLKSEYNKFVATFGNSKVEETGDWVKVLMDVSPIVSPQASFMSNFNTLICKNIITDLFVDVAFAKIGSTIRPQTKILGVHLHLGAPKKLTYHNYNSDVNKSVEYLKISVYIKFIDVTYKSAMEFAETPGLEAKLPYDFFYPFTGRGLSSHPDELMFLFMLHISVAYTFSFYRK